MKKNRLCLLLILTLTVILTGCETSPELDKDFNFSPDSARTGSDGEGFENTGWTNTNTALKESDGTFQAFEKQPFNPVYFARNKFTISTGDQRRLAKLAAYLNDNATFHLVIDGHASERGTEEYNRTLSEKRALATKKVLVGAGVDAGRINTVAYGEERPADRGTTEKSHSKNRRCEFNIGIKK